MMRKRADHPHDEGLLSSQPSSVDHRTERPVVEQFDSQIPNVRENGQKMSKSGLFWNDMKSRFSLNIEQRFGNTSSKPILTKEV